MVLQGAFVATFRPMIDGWQPAKLEMLSALIVLVNTCTAFITEVIVVSSERIYEANIAGGGADSDVALSFISTDEDSCSSAALLATNANVSV